LFEKEIKAEELPDSCGVRVIGNGITDALTALAIMFADPNPSAVIRIVEMIRIEDFLDLFQPISRENLAAISLLEALTMRPSWRRVSAFKLAAASGCKWKYARSMPSFATLAAYSSRSGMNHGQPNPFYIHTPTPVARMSFRILCASRCQLLRAWTEGMGQSERRSPRYSFEVRERHLTRDRTWKLQGWIRQ